MFTLNSVLLTMNSKYTKEQIAEAVEKSTNYSQVFRNLSLLVNGGSYRWIKSVIAKYSLSIEHFDKENRSLIQAGIDGMRKRVANKFKELDISTKGRINASILRNYLLFHKIEQRCNCCGLTDWLGKPLRLDIDHIDGNPINNKLENLQFICPNCHRAKTIQVNKFGQFENKTRSSSKRKTCLDCSKLINHCAERCHPCSFKYHAKKKREKADSRFDKNQVISLLEENSVLGTSRILGISDTGLRDYCVRNDINVKYYRALRKKSSKSAKI